MVARFSTFFALSVACAALAGCSLILDPETCGSDGECASGRTCQSGICVGPGTPEPEPQPDAMPEPDAAPIDEGMASDGMPNDMMVEPDAVVPDMVIEPDMPPMKAPPSCEITVPATAEVGPLSVETIEIQGIVTDADTAPDALTVTVAEAPVSLMANGSFTVEVPVAEGPNTIRLEATDPDMQSCDAEVRVRVDRSAPAIEILEPNNDILVNPTRNPFRVSGEFDDASNVVAIRATLNGEAVEGVNFGAGRFSFQVQLVEDDNVVSVVGEDEAGNTSIAVERVITLDSVPPEVAITAPEDGARTADEGIQITGQVTTDGIGERFSNISVTVNDEPVDLDDRTADDEGNFSVFVPLQVGANRVVVTGDDAALNPSTAEVTVTREDPAPCVDIEAPAADSFVDEGMVALNGTVCPAVDRVELRVGDGMPVAGQVADGRFEGSVPLQPGPNVITVRAITPADDAAEDQVTVSFDNTPAAVRINQPVQGACLNDETIRICGVAEDFESGIAQVRVQSGEVAAVAELDDANFCADLALMDSADARLIVTAINGAGASTRSPALGQTYSVRIDRTEPEVVVEDGENRRWFGTDAFDEVTLRGTAEGGICQPIGATWSRLCAGEVPQDPDCDPDAANNLGVQNGRLAIRSPFPDGERAIQVIVEDEAGNARTVAYSFRVDSVSPEIVSRTEDQFTPEDTIELCVNATDAASGVTDILIDNTETALVAAGQERRGCRVVDLDEGPNTFEVRVEDQVGNAAIDAITITRDTQAPTVIVTWPAAGGGVAIPTNLEGTVEDGANGSGVASVRVTSGERQFIANVDADAGTWRVTRLPVDLEDPRFTIEAVDQSGNSREIEHAVTVPSFIDLGAEQDGLGEDADGKRLLLLDATGDGRADLLSLTDQVAGSSALYVQRDDGSFLARGAADTGLPDSPALAAAMGDVNNDGDVDLVLSIAGATRLYLGDGAGGFAEVAAGLPNIIATGLTLGDVNADNNLDVVLLAGLGSRVQFGDGAGSFNSQDLGDLGLSDIGDFTWPVAVDLTGDAELDLVLLSEAGAALYVNGGDRFFLDEGFVGAAATDARWLDADRDGDLDLFTNTVGAGRFITNEGKGFGQTLLGLGFGANDRGIAAGDLNGDTFTDVITYGVAGIRVFLGGPEGFAADAQLIDVPLADVRAVEIADIDGDGDLDVVYLTNARTGVIRSNLRQLLPENTYTRLTIKRGEPGPADAIGAIIRHEYAPGMVRLVPALPGVPTVVALVGGDVEVLVEFIGGGARTVPALVPNPDPIVAPQD